LRYPATSRLLAVAAAICASVILSASWTAGGPGKWAPAAAVDRDLNLGIHDVGELHMAVSNWGMIGSMPGLSVFSGKPSAEWPGGSGVEYLFYGGFTLTKRQQVTLNVYDAAGRHVAALVSGTVDAGLSEFVWDGTTDAGNPVASGVYFYRLVAEGVEQARKMVLVQ
jgi:hypothetical protein